MRKPTRPVWRVPSSSPGPRSSKSFSAIRNPSLVVRIVSSRSLAICDSGGWYSSTQLDARLPRPTRPRSWCSCDRPRRSAFSMIISEALGTSTPTSMTVVATSRCSSPRLKASIVACFSPGFIRPCTKPTRSSGRAAVNCSHVVWAACATTSSLSSMIVHTQYACRPSAQAERMRSMSSGRRPAPSTTVCTGVRPGGSSSIADTSRSA